MFVHLHGHSHYSLLEAIGSPKNIIREAKDYGMSAIALTDYNGLYGAIEFYKAAEKEEIKALIGVELGYVYDMNIKPKQEDIGTITLLAKNYEGYQQLLKLISQANLTGRNNDKARVDLQTLEKYNKHLYLLIGGNQSFVSHMVLRNEDEDKIHEDLARLISCIGKENTIIELTVQDEQTFPTIKKVNTFLEKAASTHEVMLTCANNFHYIDEQDQKVSEVALAIKDGKRMFDEERRKVTLQQHIMSEEEIREIATNNGRDPTLIDSMIQHTADIADSINIELPLGNILFPKYESPETIQKLYEAHKDSLVS